MKKEISAGGVVYRRSEGQLEIQLIEDRFGRLTLAKGKMEPGETIEQTALREIAEETGIVGAITEPLTIIFYVYEHAQHGAIQKEVHYYLVEASSGQLAAQVEEITGVAWYNPIEAWELHNNSGYDNNNEVLRLALSKLGVEVVSNS